MWNLLGGLALLISCAACGVQNAGEVLDAQTVEVCGQRITPGVTYLEHKQAWGAVGTLKWAITAASGQNKIYVCAEVPNSDVELPVWMEVPDSYTVIEGYYSENPVEVIVPNKNVWILVLVWDVDDPSDLIEYRFESPVFKYTEEAWTGREDAFLIDPSEIVDQDLSIAVTKAFRERSLNKYKHYTLSVSNEWSLSGTEPIEYFGPYRNGLPNGPFSAKFNRYEMLKAVEAGPVSWRFFETSNYTITHGRAILDHTKSGDPILFKYGQAKTDTLLTPNTVIEEPTIQIPFRFNELDKAIDEALANLH